MFVFQLVPNFGPPSYGQVLSFVSHSFIDGGETLVFPPMSIREISVLYIFTFVDYCGQQLGEPKIRSFFVFLSPVLSIGREISVVECINIFTELSRVAGWLRMGVPKKRANLSQEKT
jgi:hypothetical protein